jgi:hypothetical protein
MINDEVILKELFESLSENKKISDIYNKHSLNAFKVCHD